ncbi:type I restriction enzyme HsdR N-terminal domain-containing protein [Rossellomorea sp. NPDC077527]|uniref:type I restriction enzyme HsdR N-terminal domain-containing protein n=1 Tax=Rossellomorea sp. NPDC077527 TaxID=3364510 RepID=UPI0037C5663D
MKVFKEGNEKVIFDPCRQILLKFTPEEEVRQNLIEILVKDMKIPIELISTEYALNKVDSNSGQRADIVVWNRGRDGIKEALLVVEVKAAHIELTDHALEQVMSYNKILKARYVGVSNGNSFNIYKIQEGKAVPLTSNLYTYSDLLEEKVVFSKSRKLRRLPYELTTYRRYVIHLLDLGYIGEGTSTNMHGFISDLQNFILCGNVLFDVQQNSIIEDLSYGFFSFGNASGGSYPGYYRSFIITDLDQKPIVVRIGVFGTSILKDDPKYGNRKGNTYLTVALDESGSSTNILQLNIDKYLIYSQENHSYEIFHSGRRNGYKSKDVIKLVEKYTPSLVEDNKVKLGILPANKSISSEEGSDFICKILDYARVRIKLAQR